MNIWYILGIACIVLLVFLIAPALVIVCMNVILEQGGSAFLIPHSFLTYASTFILLVILKGEKK